MLDAARFADTHGYHIDSGRDMTAGANGHRRLQSNKRFRSITIDRLPAIFCRTRPSNKKSPAIQSQQHDQFEGGAIPEEYLTQYIIDREHHRPVWLGLTVAAPNATITKFDRQQKEFTSSSPSITTSRKWSGRPKRQCVARV